MAFWTALKFLTVLPAPGRANTEPGQSLPYFPLVGLLLGLVLLGLDYGLSQILPAQITAGLLVIALAILTGGHHLDGLADTFDGLGGTTKEARLELMAQSGSGTAGTAAVLLLLMVKYLAIWQAAILPALLLAPALARGTIPGIIFFFPAARSSGMGHTFKRSLSKRGLTVALLIPLVAAVLLLGLKGLILTVLLWLVTLSLGYYLRHKLGGLTGDSYGALIEISEALALVLIVWLQQ
ncbi:MAG: adenosylcobinamide-GDP ribazoletransferase [Dehalococcoidales bacterium]|jgi:adenosylcobinamide-GDP ribazoletransferase